MNEPDTVFSVHDANRMYNSKGMGYVEYIQTDSKLKPDEFYYKSRPDVIHKLTRGDNCERKFKRRKSPKKRK